MLQVCQRTSTRLLFFSSELNTARLFERLGPGKLFYEQNLCFSGLENVWALIIHLMAEPNYLGSSIDMKAVNPFF